MPGLMRFRWAALALAAFLTACAGSSGAQHAPATASRIVALMPSVADDLFALGAGSKVVAVASYTHVPQAKGLPRVADFTSVDTERIVALHPDAAVGIPAQARLVAPLQRAGIAVLLLPDDRYDDIFKNLRAIGALAGRSPQAEAKIAALQRETLALHARTRGFVRHPSVFFVL